MRSYSADITIVGITLWPISGMLKVAVSAAKLTSHSAATAEPKPMQRPSIAVTTGTRQLRMAL